MLDGAGRFEIRRSIDAHNAFQWKRRIRVQHAALRQLLSRGQPQRELTTRRVTDRDCMLQVEMMARGQFAQVVCRSA
jgi:hypothetical protein